MLLSLSGKTHFLHRESPLSDQIQSVLQAYNTFVGNFVFCVDGKVIDSFDNVSPSSTIRAFVRLLGGKGGYGAKLKTEGGKKVRPNDNMFSRDTQGQRMVYSTMEKEYKQFVRKKMEEDERVAKEREQFKIMENTLKEGQSFMKLDRAYKREIEQTESNLCEAITIGKQRLLLKSQALQNDRRAAQKEEPKVEEREGSEEKKEEKDGQQEISVKRPIPAQFDNAGETLPSKAVKTQLTSQKPMFLSAQQRFKALFNK